MIIYRVMLSAEGFKIRFDGEKKPGGFVKNEYVLATSEAAAVEKAKLKTITKLVMRPIVLDCDPRNISFTVEEVESGWNILWLLRNEGFAFHPVDESRAQ